MPIIPIPPAAAQEIKQVIHFHEAEQLVAGVLKEAGTDIVEFGKSKLRGFLSSNILAEHKVAKISINGRMNKFTQVEYYNERGGYIISENPKTAFYPKGPMDKNTILKELREEGISAEKYEIYFNGERLTQKEIDTKPPLIRFSKEDVPLDYDPVTENVTVEKIVKKLNLFV